MILTKSSKQRLTVIQMKTEEEEEVDAEQGSAMVSHENRARFKATTAALDRVMLSDGSS